MSSDQEQALQEVAADLYGLPPGEFVAGRDARAAEARKAGSRSLAADIKKLRRPTASAWLANLLVRQRREQLGQLLDLGEALRNAQAQLAAADLRRLSQQRHAAIQALSGEARQLAESAGQRVSDAVREELDRTLEAALADPEAADQLRAGQLTAALSYSGLGPASTAGAPPKPHAPEAAPPPDRRAAEQALQQVAAAERVAQERAQQAAEARAAWERACAALETLEEQLSRTRAERDDLRRKLDEALAASDDAERGLAEARDAVGPD